MNELNLNEIFDGKVSSITETLSRWNLDKVYDLLSSLTDKLSSEDQGMTSAEIEEMISSIFSQKTPDVDTMISSTLSSLDELYPANLDFLTEEEIFADVDDYEAMSGDIDISTDYETLCAEITAEENEDEPVGLKKRENSFYMDFYKGFIKGQTDRAKLQAYENRTKDLASLIDTIKTEPLPDFNDAPDADPHCTPTKNYCDFIDEFLTPKYQEIVGKIQNMDNIIATLGYWNGLGNVDRDTDEIFKYMKFFKLYAEDLDFEKLTENGEDKLTEINLELFNWKDPDKESEELTEGKFKRPGQIGPDPELVAEIKDATTALNVLKTTIMETVGNSAIGRIPVPSTTTQLGVTSAPASSSIQAAVTRMNVSQNRILEWAVKNRACVKDFLIPGHGVSCRTMCQQIAQDARWAIDAIKDGARLTPFQMEELRQSLRSLGEKTSAIKNATVQLKYATIEVIQGSRAALQEGMIWTRRNAPKVMEAIAAAWTATKFFFIKNGPVMGRALAQLIVGIGVLLKILAITCVVLAAIGLLCLIVWGIVEHYKNKPTPQSAGKRSSDSKAIKILNVSAKNLIGAMHKIAANELMPIYDSIYSNIVKDVNHHRNYYTIVLNGTEYKVAIEDETGIGFIVDDNGNKKDVYSTLNEQLLDEYAANGGTAGHAAQLGFIGSINGMWWQIGDEPFYSASLDDLLIACNSTNPGDVIVIDAGYYDDPNIYKTETEEQNSITVGFWDDYEGGERYADPQVYGQRRIMENYYMKGDGEDELVFSVPIPETESHYPPEFPFVTLPQVEDLVDPDSGIVVASDPYWTCLNDGITYQPGEQANVGQYLGLLENINFEVSYRNNIGE